MRWRDMADLLAQQLAAHADCDEHPASRPCVECPFCEDRAVYLKYVGAGGRDFRFQPAPSPEGPGIPFQEVKRRMALLYGVRGPDPRNTVVRFPTREGAVGALLGADVVVVSEDGGKTWQEASE